MSNFVVHGRYDKAFYRALGIMPGFLSWATIIACFIFSFTHPIPVAIFIICFDVYWLIRVVYLASFLIRSFKQIKKNTKIDWHAKLHDIKKCDELYHLVIIPTYKEEINIVRPTFEALVNSNYSNEKMIVVLAIEERDKERGMKNAQIIKDEFGDIFHHFMITVHPKDLEGEIPGKGSNEAWAGRRVKEYIDEKGIAYEDILVSTLDVDTCVHPEYFARLTYVFFNTDDPLHASYQPVPMFFNNFWDAPALMRVVAMSNTFWMLMEQARPERLYTFSSHSMSFKALVDVDFWDTDFVSEDSHIFWQCFMRYNGNYRTEPLLIPVYMDTVLADTYSKSIINQYKQQRRWAWGSENIPYIFLNFRHNKKIPFSSKLSHGFRVIEGFHSWATNALMIFILGWLPLIVGGDAFKTTLLAQNLPLITQWLMTFSMVGMFISATLNLFLLPERPKKYGGGRFVMMFLQWFFLPITTIFLGSFPAIDAQTRMMFGKRMGFWTTQKFRKS
ncbi:glycosyltransferase family 2 protein [Patescibacteria group bacterium]|nr:glycosyltransferase family 2 protein [Patescibacteria group bacterium]